MFETGILELNRSLFECQASFEVVAGCIAKLSLHSLTILNSLGPFKALVYMSTVPLNAPPLAAHGPKTAVM